MTEDSTENSQHYVKDLAEEIQKIWLQDNILEWHNFSKVSLSSQTPNRIQHDQELRVFHPMQLYTMARHTTH